MQERSFIGYIMVTLRGVAMGAADVIPGVSGGTIAFITGIYEELISSLSNINLRAFKVLKKEGLKAFWKYVNGNFFLALFFGIGISILTLSKIVVYLLSTYPVLLWSFFFGLVIASAILIGKSIKNWNLTSIVCLLLGTAIAGYISSIESIAVGGSSWYIFLSGAIAICAMILPGISGAFILVLLGSYGVVMTGLKTKDLTLIGYFLSGCLVGILAFSKVLKFLFSNYKSYTLSVLCGFLIGSLYKIWPWKNRVGGFDAEPIIVHSDGREEFMLTNVMPSDFVANYQTVESSKIIGESNLPYAIALGVFGLVLILILERLAPKDAS